MRPSLLIPVSLSILLVSACVSVGTNYDQAAVSRLTPGMSKASVIALLGKPTTTVTLADGSQHINWVYSRGTMLGTAEGRSLTLIFEANGTFRQTLAESATELR